MHCWFTESDPVIRMLNRRADIQRPDTLLSPTFRTWQWTRYVFESLVDGEGEKVMIVHGI